MTKNLSSLSSEEIQEHLKNKSLKIGVIGVGRIGLPTALCFASSGLETIGIDINSKLVEMINSGDYPLKDEPGFDKLFDNAISEKKFSATTEISDAVPKCDVILLSLPTPMNNQNVPDYTALLTVGRSLNGLLSNGQIVIVESTVEPGFIENELLNSIEGTEKTLKSGIDFHLAVCPETANPGEIMKDFQKLPRLVGALEKNISPIVTAIYDTVFGVELIQMPNCKTANAVKLTTNVFRDVNIAFINELAILFEKLGIDTYAVIDAAKKKYNFQAHYPGPGVGGPCLPVNSYQYLNSSKKINHNFLKIVDESRKINEAMPNHVIKLLEDAFTESNKSFENSKITLLGISYKPNVRDIQIAPSAKIIELLRKRNVIIKIFDPYFISTKQFGIEIENSFSNAINESDAVLVVTGHKEFKNLDLNLISNMTKNPIIVDCTGMIKPENAYSKNIIFRGIGRGKA